MAGDEREVFWETPVYDRTQADVDNAILQIAKWKESGSVANVALKGCLEAGDLNRIEDNTQYLSDILSSLYYFSYVETYMWGMTEIPNINDVNRIIGNVGKLISAFYKHSAAPELPETMLRFEEINSIEKNLYLLKEILDNMIASFRECGTFKCGED